MAKPTISVGEIIDKSWHIYKQHFGEFMSVSGWLLAVAVLNIVALALYPSATVVLSARPYGAAETFGTILLILNNFLVAPLLGIWITATLVRLIDTIVSGSQKSLKTVMKDGRKFFWPFLLVSVLFSLVILATMLFLLPGIFFTLVGRGLSGMGTLVAMIGALLLIIGIVLSAVMAILWGVRFFFSTYTLLVDGHRGRTALKASYRLVHGNFWEILVRLVLPKALFFIVFAFGLFIVNTIASMVISGAAGLNIDLQVRLTTIVTGVLVLIQTVLINPIILVSDYLIYKDMTR